MIYLVFLFVFNLIIIIILSNIKSPSIPSMFEYKIVKVMGLQNNIACDISEIIDYHPLSVEFKKEENSYE